jgi:ribosomal protein S18 acetylase RimI-like enzyme
MGTLRRWGLDLRIYLLLLAGERRKTVHRDMRRNSNRQDMSPAQHPEWRVRQARPSDRAFVLGITPRLAQGFELPSWRTERDVVAAESATLEKALQAGTERAALLVAEDTEGEPGGYVLVKEDTDYFGRRHAHIETLAVSAATEGRGAGRALMDAAEGWARSKGLDLITLNVFANNQRAQSLYQRLGYAPDTLHYVKPLT